jgi:hypothetical protein
MKTWISQINQFLTVGAASLVALGATAQTTAPSATTTSAAPSSNAATARLPYGVDAVVKLSQEHISQAITLNYIQNSGTIYDLGPDDIVYLRNEGVSDNVINALLDQRQNVPLQVAVENTLQAQAAASVNVAATVNGDPGNIQAGAAYFPPPPVYVQPVPVYVQPDPVYVPASTLYIIPYGSSK